MARRSTTDPVEAAALQADGARLVRHAHDMALDLPAAQGRGLGRVLLRHAIARCTAAGEACIGLTVTEGNPAERLYAALGFRRRRTLYVFED